MRRAALLALAIGLACKAEVGPRPTGIAPEHGPADVPVQVTIRGSAFQPQVVTDFEHAGSSVVDARFSARLGSVALRDVQLAPDGTLAATVPAGLPVGVHDLTVTRPDGRKGSLVAAYRALGADELGEVVASYRIELTGNPPFQAYQPVQVTITALDSQGEVATDFGGAVALEDGTGTAVPARAGLFERGRWTGLVEIRAGTPSDALVASDASGHRGTSPDFAVLPSAPARLAFGSPPSQLAAGACSGAIELRLLDAFGGATAAPAPLAISIDAGPDAGLYSDDACTVALDPTVPAYGGVLSLRFRTPHAGSLALKAAAPGLGEALATAVEVVPGPPAGLAFVSPPRTLDAGACISASVEAQDAFGNSVDSPGLLVALAAAPAEGLTFHGAQGCTSGITSVVASDGGRATFWFSGTVPEIVTVTASAPGLASASQDERVVPQGQAAGIAFLTLPFTVTAGACSPAITLQAQDSYGNAVAGAAPVQVTLDSTAQVVPDPVLGGLLFFADASCASPVATVVIPAGAATADVHSRGGAAGSYLVTARGEGLSGASLAGTVVAGPAASVSFTTGAQSLLEGVCSAPVAVAVRDSFGNPARPDGVPLTVEAPASLVLYGDACTGVLDGPLVVAEGGTAQFWFKGSQAGPARVSVWLGSAAGASQDEFVQ